MDSADLGEEWHLVGPFLWQEKPFVVYHAEIKWLNLVFMASLNICAATSECDSEVFLKSKQNLSVYFFIASYFGISMGEQFWISSRLGNSLMLFESSGRFSVLGLHCAGSLRTNPALI